MGQTDTSAISTRYVRTLSVVNQKRRKKFPWSGLIVKSSSNLQVSMMSLSVFVCDVIVLSLIFWNSGSQVGNISYVLNSFTVEFVCLLN